MFFIQIDYGIHNFVLIWSTITYVCVASNDVDDKCNQLQIQLHKCNPECWLETFCALLSKKESSAKQKKYCKLIAIGCQKLTTFITKHSLLICLKLAYDKPQEKVV